MPTTSIGWCGTTISFVMMAAVELAFKAFFRRVKERADDPGYPRFKAFGRYDSMTYPQYGNGVRLEGNKLLLLRGYGLKKPPASVVRVVTRRLQHICL
jgi:hypothetical protein